MVGNEEGYPYFEGQQRFEDDLKARMAWLA